MNSFSTGNDYNLSMNFHLYLKLSSYPYFCKKLWAKDWGLNHFPSFNGKADISPCCLMYCSGIFLQGLKIDYVKIDERGRKKFRRKTGQDME
jgi:hypothetical protein